MNGLAIGAVFAIFSVVALLEAIRCARLGERGRAWALSGMSVPAAIGAGLFVWLEIANPVVRSARAQALDPGWFCRDYGKGAIFCRKDDPLAAREEPKPWETH